MEAAFDGVGGSHRLACGEGLVAKASETLVEIVAQTGDGGGVGFAPAQGEVGARRERAFVAVSAFMTACRSVLTDASIDFFDLVEDVADLVRPAAPDRDLVVDHGQGGQEP